MPGREKKAYRGKRPVNIIEGEFKTELSHSIIQLPSISSESKNNSRTIDCNTGHNIILLSDTYRTSFLSAIISDRVINLRFKEHDQKFIRNKIHIKSNKEAQYIFVNPYGAYDVKLAGDHLTAGYHLNIPREAIIQFEQNGKRCKLWIAMNKNDEAGYSTFEFALGAVKSITFQRENVKEDESHIGKFFWDGQRYNFTTSNDLNDNYSLINNEYYTHSNSTVLNFSAISSDKSIAFDLPHEKELKIEELVKQTIFLNEAYELPLDILNKSAYVANDWEMKDEWVSNILQDGIPKSGYGEKVSDKKNGQYILINNTDEIIDPKTDDVYQLNKSSQIKINSKSYERNSSHEIIRTGGNDRFIVSTNNFHELTIKGGKADDFAQIICFEESDNKKLQFLEGIDLYELRWDRGIVKFEPGQIKALFIKKAAHCEGYFWTGEGYLKRKIEETAPYKTVTYQYDHFQDALKYAPVILPVYSFQKVQEIQAAGFQATDHQIISIQDLVANEYSVKNGSNPIVFIDSMITKSGKIKWQGDLSIPKRLVINHDIINDHKIDITDKGEILFQTNGKEVYFPGVDLIEWVRFVDGKWVSQSYAYRENGEYFHRETADDLFGSQAPIQWQKGNDGYSFSFKDTEYRYAPHKIEIDVVNKALDDSDLKGNKDNIIVEPFLNAGDAEYTIPENQHSHIVWDTQKYPEANFVFEKVERINTYCQRISVIVPEEDAELLYNWHMMKNDSHEYDISKFKDHLWFKMVNDTEANDKKFDMIEICSQIDGQIQPKFLYFWNVERNKYSYTVKSTFFGNDRMNPYRYWFGYDPKVDYKGADEKLTSIEKRQDGFILKGIKKDCIIKGSRYPEPETTLIDFRDTSYLQKKKRIAVKMDEGVYATYSNNYYFSPLSNKFEINMTQYSLLDKEFIKVNPGQLIKVFVNKSEESAKFQGKIVHSMIEIDDDLRNLHILSQYVYKIKVFHWEKENGQNHFSGKLCQIKGEKLIPYKTLTMHFESLYSANLHYVDMNRLGKKEKSYTTIHLYHRPRTKSEYMTRKIDTSITDFKLLKEINIIGSRK